MRYVSESGSLSFSDYKLNIDRYRGVILHEIFCFRIKTPKYNKFSIRLNSIIKIMNS